MFCSNILISISRASAISSERIRRHWAFFCPTGRLHRIQVYLAWVSGYDPKKFVPPVSGYDSKPYVPLLDATIDLSAHIAKESYFGFSGSTGTHIQLNSVLSWNLTVEILPENKPFNWFLKIGVPITVALLLVVACLGFWAYRRPEKAEERLACEGLPPVVCCIVGKASSQGMFFLRLRETTQSPCFCYGSYRFLCRLDRDHSLGSF